MVKKLEIEALSVEAESLEALLRARTEQDDPIGVYQFKQRLEQVRQRIGEIAEAPALTAGVALFFAGGPVTGSRGIRADFAGKAVESFQAMVAKKFAAFEVGELGQRGRIPLRASSDLILTDVVRGSVGLVLEEANDNVPIVETELKVVLDDVVCTIAAAAQEEAEPFEEILEDIDSRFLRSMGEFFALLDDADATVRLVEGERDRQFDHTQIHRARERTDAAEINERDNEVLVGALYLLPAHRKFELVLDSGETVWGPVSAEFAGQHLEALRNANDVVGHRWRVRVKVRVVTRPNRLPKTTHKLLGLIERLD